MRRLKMMDDLDTVKKSIANLNEAKDSIKSDFLAFKEHLEKVSRERHQMQSILPN